MDRLSPDSLTDTVDLWLCRPDAISDPVLLEGYARLLGEEERGRWMRLRSERDRKRFLVTRAVIRAVLSIYVDLPAGAWQFTRNRWNKPEIAAHQNRAGLRPNLAHTPALICCAVTCGSELGVDVENVDRRSATRRVAKRFFAPGEFEGMSALAEQAQRGRFFDLWTLKESYIKARGVGIAAGLHNFCFDIDPDAGISIRFAAGFVDDPVLWNFCLLQVRQKYRVAIAVKGTSARTSPRIAIREITPLLQWRDEDALIVVPFRRRI
jgi:4'-phosphopantetheinyl transferase